MEVIKDNLQVRAFLLERFLEIRVHVARHSLHALHPVKTDEINEVIDDLLLLARLNPQNMACFQVGDVSGIAVAVVQQEFVNAQKPGQPFRFSQLLAIDSAKLLKPPLVNLLDCVLPKSCKIGHCLVIQSPGKQITRVIVQIVRYPVAGSLEMDVLAFSLMASGTAELVMLIA